MSFIELLDQLPTLTPEQRQEVVLRAIRLDEAPLSLEDERLVSARLAAHAQDPASSVPLEEMRRRLLAKA